MVATSRHTRFTDLVGCSLPFQLAVLGGVGTTELAAAVARGGGLGMVPYGKEAPHEEGHVGIGFLMPFVPSHETIRERARAVRVVEFFFGGPDPSLVEAAHDGGALVSWQVGSTEEARAAEAAGCDLVVAQGIEAGGHVRGSEPLDGLLHDVLAAVRVPVVAAGGIGSARRVADLIAAGADAVRVGTRFVATPECNAHPAYVAALVRAQAGDAVLTDHFDENGAWPAPVRVLASSLDAARAAGNRSTMPPLRDAPANPGAMAMYAGLSAAGVRSVRTAGSVLEELVEPLR